MERVIGAAQMQGLDVKKLPVPMRWSEDFGYFLQKAPGCYFGIGAGNVPELHTEGFEFNDAVIPYALKAFVGLIQSEARA